MWTSIWTFMKGRPLLAAISALACILVFASAIGGISARHAATRYFDRAWEWAKAYDRDRAASKKEYEAEIKQLTADRDAYRKKWEAAKGKMGKPWTPPSNAKALQERFNRLGYRGTLR